MSEQRRFIRFVIEGELEITDRIQTRAYLNDFGSTDEHGNLGMVAWDEHSEQVHPPEPRVLKDLMIDAFNDKRDRLGFMLWATSAFGRPAVGEEHPEITLPAMPISRGGGSSLGREQ